MKKICYLFVFNDFADYETSLVSVGINKSKLFQVKTIALTKDPVRSMSGATIIPDLDFVPDVDLKDIDRDNTAMLILPGGPVWENKKNDAIAPLLDHCVSLQIPVAAICGATIFLADRGLLDNVDHTSNALEYLNAFAKRYYGQSLYRNAPSVRTDNIITASGTASVEFAQDVLDRLGIVDDKPVHEWFQYFQYAMA